MIVKNTPLTQVVPQLLGGGESDRVHWQLKLGGRLHAHAFEFR